MRSFALILAVGLLIAAIPAQAQTETVLYNFCSQPNCTDGEALRSNLTSDEAGNFYGTTGAGGTLGLGTVFELSPNGNGGWNETVLYSFTGEDGSYPQSPVIFDSKGNLYGTTYQGGDLNCNPPNGCGVVFELSPVAGSWAETVLFNFCQEGVPCNITGGFPPNGLVFDSVGNLYGTTSLGSGGMVFELNPSGGGWTEQVIYTASNNDDGAMNAGLAMDADGNIFGASANIVFELSPNGNGGWSSTAMYTFAPSVYIQSTPVLGKTGEVYGSTVHGGDKGDRGMVYKLSRGKKGWKETDLYAFKGGPSDGEYPYGGIVFDAAGNIYGTTTNGGKYSYYGTVFELVAPVGKGKYQEKILWNFDSIDGAYPHDSMILDSAGNLYGTTWQGGEYSCGVVFEVTP